jgi:acetyl-CoA acetyltransferase
MFNAIAAIHAQLARHVLVFRTVGEATARQTSFANSLQQQTPRQFGAFAGYAPYHVYAAATQQALYFQRYVHESGIREEQIAQIAINGRRNAALNDNAIYRSPISLDDYLASPIISTPLHLYDCDVPVDGSTAIVLSRVEEARDMPNPVIWIEAVGSRMADRNSWTELEDLAGQVAPHPAAMMWSRTDLTPANVDAAQLYDGFSFHTLAWLEAFGFCKRYEAGDFIAGGERIALQGQLPINTSGGQLSAGRLHGYGALHEACAQMWRRCGPRQIQKEVKVTATCTAGGPLGGCMLLVRD